MNPPSPHPAGEPRDSPGMLPSSPRPAKATPPSPPLTLEAPLAASPAHERRLSWVSEQRGRFVGGLSAVALAGELRRVLREPEETALVGRLEALLARVGSRARDTSVVVALAGGGWAVASPRPQKVSWRLVRSGPRPPNPAGQPGPLITLREAVDLGGREVLAASLVRARRPMGKLGVEGAHEKEEQAWELSCSSFSLRWPGVLETHGAPRHLSGFVPALGRVEPGGWRASLSPRVMSKASPALRERLSRAGEELRRTCGLPLEASDTLRAKVRAHPTLKDGAVLARVGALARYIVFRRGSYDEQSAVLEGLARRVAANGVDPSCLGVLDEEWVRATGRKEKGCRLRMGAFLPNANILVQYTHCRNSSSACSWAPLAFGHNKTGSPVLKATSVDPWAFGELVCGVPLPHLAPRLLVFMLHRGGKKVINGQIYDLVGMRGDIARGAEASMLRCIPLYRHLGEGAPERGGLSPLKLCPGGEVDGGEGSEGDNVEVVKSPPPLPIVSMGVLDGWAAAQEARGGAKGGEREKKKKRKRDDKPLSPAPTPTCEKPPAVQPAHSDGTRLGLGAAGDTLPPVGEWEGSLGGSGDPRESQANLPPSPAGASEATKAVSEAEEAPAPVPTNTLPPTRSRVDGPGPVVDIRVTDSRVIVTLEFARALVTGEEVRSTGTLARGVGACSNAGAPPLEVQGRVDIAPPLFSTPTAGGAARASSAGTGRRRCCECGGGQASGRSVQASRVAEGCNLHVVPSVTSQLDQAAKGSGLASTGRGSVWRSGSLDLRTGRKTETRVEVPVSSQAPWYDQEWYHIYDDRSWYASEGPTPRVVPQRLKEKFVATLGRCGAEVMQRAWLNLPRFLQHPTQRELRLVYGEGRQGMVSSLHLAVDQFYRGSWGKAFKTLMGINEGEVLIPKEEVLRLFPRCADGAPPEGEEAREWVLPSEALPITATEVGAVASILPRGKACGLSGCSYEVIKQIASLKSGRSSLAAMYSHMLLHPEAVHAQLYTSRCVGIPKRGGGVRPLCMQEAVVKPLHRILAGRIERCVAGKMCTAQMCLGAREGQGEAHGLVVDALERLGPEAAVVFFDFTNAFGTVSRASITRRLTELGVPAVLTRYVAVMLSRQRLTFSSPEGHRETLDIQTGVPQGEPLSMLLFAVGIDSLLADFQAIDGVEVAAYADDVALVARCPKDTPFLIQAFMDEAASRGLKVNLAKTKVAFKNPLDTETRAALEAQGVSLVDLRTEVAQYVGLPVGMSPAAIEQHIAARVKEFIQDTRKLWGSGVPLQMKYHLQETCLNSRLVFIFRNTPFPKLEHSLWMGEMQRELDELWETHLGVVPKPFRRLPVRFYGVGLFHIKDRRTVARRAREKLSGEQKDDPSAVFFSRKVEAWVRKQRMVPLDIRAVPSHANLVLSSPPAENSARLEDTAFRLMLATRYCSSGMDLQRVGGLRYKCPLHNKGWSLQHILACPLSTPLAVRKQHDSLVGYVCGILLRSHRVQQVHRERKSVEQERRCRAGLEAKRADITFLLDGAQHSLDVSVTTSWSETPGSYATIHAYKRKTREYRGEGNLHVLLFDTSGGLNQAGWNLLRGLGAHTEDLRRMQTKVLRGNAERYQAVVMMTKNRLYREDRNADRARRCPPPAPDPPHSEGCESTPPSPQEGAFRPLAHLARTAAGGEIRGVGPPGLPNLVPTLDN